MLCRALQAGNLTTKFKPYSRFPPCYKDMAFWISPQFSENNLCELVGEWPLTQSTLCQLVAQQGTGVCLVSTGRSCPLAQGGGLKPRCHPPMVHFAPMHTYTCIHKHGALCTNAYIRIHVCTHAHTHTEHICSVAH